MGIHSKRVVACVEARMTSTRLPGKVLKPCLDRPLLALLVERLRRSRHLDEIVVATTVNAADDVIVETARGLGVSHFRGEETDVMGRVTGAMAAARADLVVRITSDCPLVDPAIVDQVVEVHAANAFDFVSNCQVRSYPRGLDVQVSSFEALERSLALARTGPEREFVFLSLYGNPDRFRLFNIFAPPELCHPDWRWTLDTPADYAFITRVYESLYPENPGFTSSDILRLLQAHPEIPALNRNIPHTKIPS